MEFRQPKKNLAAGLFPHLNHANGEMTPTVGISSKHNTLIAFSLRAFVIRRDQDCVSRNANV